jgi:hypothetical protein
VIRDDRAMIGPLGEGPDKGYKRDGRDALQRYRQRARQRVASLKLRYDEQLD